MSHSPLNYHKWVVLLVACILHLTYFDIGCTSLGYQHYPAAYYFSINFYEWPVSNCNCGITWLPRVPHEKYVGGSTADSTAKPLVSRTYTNNRSPHYWFFKCLHVRQLDHQGWPTGKVCIFSGLFVTQGRFIQNREARAIYTPATPSKRSIEGDALHAYYEHIVPNPLQRDLGLSLCCDKWSTLALATSTLRQRYV